ncbi:response regulator [Runella sp. SP2]|nr:response regulator [Runella sp. SP2]
MNIFLNLSPKYIPISCVFFVLFLGCLNSFAQQKTRVEDLKKAQLYLEKAEWFRYEPQFNYDSTLYYAKKALTVLEKQPSKSYTQLIEAYLKLASYELIPAQKDSALLTAERYSKMINSNILKYRVLYRISDRGWAGYKTQDRDVFKEANALIEDNNDPAIKAEYEFGLGGYYAKSTDGKEFGRACLLRSLAYYQTKDDKLSLQRRASIYMSLHNLKFVENQMDSAKLYLEKIEPLLPEVPLMIQLSYLGIRVNYHKTLKQLEIAQAYASEYLRLLEKYKLQNSHHGQMGLFNLGHIYFLRGNNDEAIAYYKQALALGESLNIHSTDYDIWHYTADAYEKKGDFKNAYEAQKKFLAEAVKRLDINHHNAVKELEIQYDLKEKAKAQIKQAFERKMLIGSVVLLVILVCSLAFFYLKSRRAQRIIAQQSEALHQLDAAKSRFFANVSHELRTPLTLMLAPLSTIIKSGTLDTKNQRLVGLIRQNAEHLLKLVNEILDLNKLEVGKLEVREEPVVLYNFIRRIAANFESAAAARHIRFVFTYRIDTYLQFLLDKDKVQKIVNNLLSNAVKFTAENGTITITVEEHQHRICIKVADTGRGIHPEDLPRIFDRFYQSNQADALVEGGTGIGLSLSAELAKLIDGQLQVESVLKEGSVFSFYFPKKEVLTTINDAEAYEIGQPLPLTQEVDLGVMTFATPIEEGQKETILIVEDNQSLREYLVLILQDKYKVLKAENGQVAMQKLKIYPKPSLILTDVMMPVLDGYQLVNILKTDDDLCTIPVIMLTARAELQDKLKALRIGVDDYLVKPFEEEELLVRMSNLLQYAQKRATEPLTVEKEEVALGNSSETDVAPVVSVNDMVWLAQLESRVKLHLKETDYSVERMADDMALSRTQLFRKLKNLTGLSPQQYLQEVRLQQALYLLETRQEQSVKAVCYAVGLLQVKHFSQQFHRRFGRLPSSYL